MQLKNLLLKTAMDFVPTHGWTSRSIREAAKSLSAPTVTSGLFPLKGMELIDHYSRQVEQECRDRTELYSPDFYVNVAALLKERLHALEPKKELWKLALEEMSKAQNLRFGVDNLLRSADEFCYLAGDRSFDFTYHARRAAIAGVISSTDLYFVNDISRESLASYKFLERLIDRVKQTERSGQVFEQLAKTVTNSIRNLA
ncbi:hypothetical protein MP638_006983 [Amoeboaphelidium occidentale]|nr:hypothetical protein MP638_006983 [Amoeboaphelidium occidentale]